MTDAVYKSVIIFIIMNFVLFLIIIIASGIDTTKGRGFLYKKICDIIVIIFQYLILISMYPVINFVNEYIGRWTIIVTLVNIVYIFKLGCSQLLLLRYSIPDVKDTETFIMIISIFVQVFIMIAGLYFCLYMINSGWFNINSDYTNNMWKLGFEFIYFTFSVTITYSGSDIEVVGVIPKIIQMAHVIFFYFYAGDLLLKIVKKRNEIK